VLSKGKPAIVILDPSGSLGSLVGALYEKVAAESITKVEADETKIEAK
jgi:hypothetical protein